MPEAEGYPAQPTRQPLALNRSECWVLLVLAAVQFTHIMDFMIVMPLQPHMKDELRMEPRHFGLLVSAYGFCASVAGFLAASFIDRFDRKRALVMLYAGFTTGTLLCAIASNYGLLVFARGVAGAFGGVSAALVLAIIGDVFADFRRGRAMGLVMSAFSVAAIAGVPAGLILADRFNWRMPFAALGVLSALVLLLAIVALPPLRSHLERRPDTATSLWTVLVDPIHMRAYLLMTMLVLSGFMISPFMADYMVANVGLAKSDLGYIYFCGGAITLLTLTPIGALADRFGKLPVFRIFAWLTMVSMLIVTHLPPVSLALVLVVTTFIFVVTSGRMVPAMALITASAAPRNRGSFLSVNSSVQQMAIGLGALVGGCLMERAADGTLIGFPRLGWLAAIATVMSVFLAGRLRSGEEMPQEARESLTVQTETILAAPVLSPAGEGGD